MKHRSPGLFADETREDAPSEGPRTSLSDWITAHTDGGARGNPGPAGYGVAITDAGGRSVAELSEFLGVRTNNVAEYAALLGALAWAEETGHTHLRIVSDSELMVKQIQGRYKVASPDLRPMFEEARRRIGRLEGFSITHALRGQNKAADRLANLAMDKGMGRAPSSDPPPRPDRPAQPAAAPASTLRPTMLRGFVKGGSVHLLGGASLPDGVFVKVIPEE
jgi:ribonuclease HI